MNINIKIGVAKMSLNERSTLVCPPEYAYG